MFGGNLNELKKQSENHYKKKLSLSVLNSLIIFQTKLLWKGNTTQFFSGPDLEKINFKYRFSSIF